MPRRPAGGSAGAAPAARHARSASPPPGLSPAQPDVDPAAPATAPPPHAQPATLSLVLSRRARREAAAAAAAAAVVDRRLQRVERALTGFQIAGNALALALSAVAWVWVAAHRSGVAVGEQPGALANDAVGGSGLASTVLFHPLATLSGAALVLIMLPACLLMAPAVNPFYAPPPDRRLLHASRTVVFVVLAVSTVAVITGAAR